MVGNDACINIGQLFTIKGTCPDLICIAANDNCQRRTIDICGLSNFTKALITLHYNQVLRLAITTRGCNVSCL